MGSVVAHLKTEEEKKAALMPLLERALNGQSQQEIAASLGVHQTALSQLFLRYCEDEWKEIQVARAWTEFDNCVQNLADAEKTPDMTSINRARELAKTAQWRLTVLHRRLFGEEQAQALLGQGLVSININLGERSAPKDVVSDQQVIDSE